MRTITFHIGTHKTGTTSIQRFLRANEAGLAAGGIVYPRAGRLKGGSHHNLLWEVVGDKRFQPRLGTLDDLEEELEEQPDQDAILSCEAFSTRQNEEEVPERLSALATRLGRIASAIVYFRPQTEYLEALYLQETKSGQRIDTFARFVDRACSSRRFDYAGLLDIWERHMTVVVRPYGKTQREHGVVADFLRASGLDNRFSFELEEGNYRENMRIGGDLSEALRLLTRRLWQTGYTKPQTEKVVGSVARRIGRSEESDNVSIMSLRTFRDLRRHYEPVNQPLYLRFPEISDEFQSSMEAQEQRLMDAKFVSSRAVRDALVTICADLVQRGEVVEDRRRPLRER